MAKLQIYHNPRCSTSRKTLALLQEQGYEPEVIKYLETPPDATTLDKLLKQLKLEPLDVIRRKEYQALDLPEETDRQKLIERIVANPQVLQRPIVVHGNKAVLGRPPENALQVL